MLDWKEKWLIRIVMIIYIRQYGQIDTRRLIEMVYNQLNRRIHTLTKWHIWGMLSWLLSKRNHTDSYKLIVRQPGHSIVAYV